jgi:hypothetical protein
MSIIPCSEEYEEEGQLWRPIPGFFNYAISNLGNVYSYTINNQLIPYELGGYYGVGIVDNTGKRSRMANHILVALSFLGPKPGDDYVVNHIDGNRLNNEVSNLQWLTSSQNTIHAIETGLKITFTRPVNKYNLNGKFIATYSSVTAAADSGEFSRSAISRACDQKNKYKEFLWRYVEEFDNKEDGAQRREIEDFQNYSVTEDGRIFSKSGRKYLKLQPDKNGYLTIQLIKNNFRKRFFIHVLVARAYIFNPDPINKIWVDHINGKKNDNRASNLRWVTKSENMIYYLMNRDVLNNDTELIEHKLDSLDIDASEIYEKNEKDENIVGKNFTKSTSDDIEPWVPKTGTNRNSNGFNILKLNLNNEYIATYNSIREAGRITGIDRKDIGNACKNKGIAGGYKWLYENENLYNNNSQLTGLIGNLANQ